MILASELSVWSSRIWVDPFVIITMIAILMTSLFRAWRKVRSLFHPLIEMALDWHGSPDRPGVPGRPGVMTRLESHEQQLAYIKGELSVDHGRSVKDTVIKIADRMGVDTNARVIPMPLPHEMWDQQQQPDREPPSHGGA